MHHTARLDPSSRRTRRDMSGSAIKCVTGWHRGQLSGTSDEWSAAESAAWSAAWSAADYYQWEASTLLRLLSEA